MPWIRRIAAIDAVLATRSFRLGAERLGTTQPTLSRLIAAAEAELGATLFLRGWSGAEATRAGEAVAREARAAMAAIRAAEAVLRPEGRGPALGVGLAMRELAAVDAVVRTGSVSAAARSLGISQPAVSRALSGLAGHHGLTLFRRRREGMEALPAARTLAELYGTLALRLSRLPAAAQAGEGLSGRVAVGLLPFSGQDMIPKVFARLAERHQGLRLVCVPGGYPALCDALRRREVDRIVGIARGAACPADLAETPLYAERFSVVARADHPCHTLTITGPRPIADFHKAAWSVAPPGTPIRDYFERAFGDPALVPPVRTCEMLSFAAAEQLVAASEMLMMLCYAPARGRTPAPGLRLVDIDLPDDAAPIAMTALRGQPADPGLAAFEAELLRVVAASAPA